MLWDLPVREHVVAFDEDAHHAVPADEKKLAISRGFGVDGDVGTLIVLDDGHVEQRVGRGRVARSLASDEWGWRADGMANAV
jgi:hypothetical protein